MRPTHPPPPPPPTQSAPHPRHPSGYGLSPVLLIVMEFAEKGTLQDFIEAQQEKQVRNVVFDRCLSFVTSFISTYLWPWESRSRQRKHKLSNSCLASPTLSSTCTVSGRSLLLFVLLLLC